MIHFHLYARLDDTAVYPSPDDGQPAICTVRKGCWFGVTGQDGAWVRVIAATCQGWVRASDVEPKSPLDLHALVNENTHLSYVNTGLSR